MTGFVSLSKILPKSVIGIAVGVHKLTPTQLLVFLQYYSHCYKGSRYRSMNLINSRGIRLELLRIYGLELSRQQIERSTAKIVKLGLLERKTAVFAMTIGTQKFPTKVSYYRLPL